MRPVALEQKLTYANLTTSEEFDFIGEFGAHGSWQTDRPKS